MKKVRALSALLVAAALSLGSAGIVFAAEGAAPAKEYSNLEVTQKSYYNLRYAEVGTYPVITGYGSLNDKILKDLEDAYSLATDKYFTDSANVFIVSYKVTDSNQFAKIEVTYKYELTAIKMQYFDEVKTYYVDKELVKEITEDEFKAGTEKKEEAPAAAPAAETPAATPEEPATPETPAAEQESDEVVLVPIRSYAVGLGYTVVWDDSTKSVVLTKGDARFTVTVGKNEYVVNGQPAQLELAPANQNGTVYVPVSFFEKVLGAVYSVDTAGNIVIAEK